MAKAQWEQLPTDVDTLKKMLQTLKDKEARLEADLAIKEHPEVEESVIRLALAMAEVRKLDIAIAKSPQPERDVSAMLNRLQYLENQITSLRDALKTKDGKIAEKWHRHQKHRESALKQLKEQFDGTCKVFREFDLQPERVLPSIAEYVGELT